MAIRFPVNTVQFSRLLIIRCGCRLKTKIKFPLVVRLSFGSPRKFGLTHGEVKPPFWFALSLVRFGVLPSVLTTILP